jgi:hypothetical protein
MDDLSRKNGTVASFLNVRNGSKAALAERLQSAKTDRMRPVMTIREISSSATCYAGRIGSFRPRLCKNARKIVEQKN